MDNPGQVVTDSEEEVVRKKNERAAKNKERLEKLRAPVPDPAAGSAGSPSSPRSVPAETE